MHLNPLMDFNPYSIPPIISLAAIFTIGLLAYRHNPSSPINKSFLYFCLSLCFWLFNFSMMYNCKNASWGLFWVRLGFLGNPFIPISGYYFVNQLLHINPVPHFKKLLIFAFLSITLFNSDLIYAGIKKDFWGPYPIAGKIYFIYMIFFAILFLICIKTLFVYMQKMNTPRDQYKRQEIKYVLFAFILGTTGLIDFIAKYPVRIYPIGWLSALLFISLICYAILKHQILENELLRQEVAQTEKFKAVAALASCLVHEIRNPLTAINTFTEFLPQRTNDPVFLEQFSQTVPKEIKRINSLMQELLIFAKPSPPQLQSTDALILLNSLVVLLQEQCKRQKINIVQSFDHHTPQSIHADPNQLKQALLNILLNAIDAMPNGGTLTITTSLSFPNASVGNPQYIINITDTGCGIAPKDLPHIFEPFFTKKEKGTGLGLAITQGIIEKHGGKILVKSQLNQGTTFSITLPIDHAY